MDIQRVEKFQQVAPKRRKLTAARGLCAAKARGAEPAQSRTQHSIAGTRQMPGNLLPSFRAVRPAVDEYGGTLSGRVLFQVGHIQQPRADKRVFHHRVPPRPVSKLSIEESTVRYFTMPIGEELGDIVNVLK